MPGGGGNVDEQRVPVTGMKDLQHDIPTLGVDLRDEGLHLVRFCQASQSLRHRPARVPPCGVL